VSKMIIFTDLDGTLLNHKSYDYKAVLPLLERLKSLDIPVVLNSSKTLSELDEWKSKLKLSTPVIAENGGVMTVSSLSKKGEEKILIGRPYEEIRSFIKHLRALSPAMLLLNVNRYDSSPQKVSSRQTLQTASHVVCEDV